MKHAVRRNTASNVMRGNVQFNSLGECYVIFIDAFVYSCSGGDCHRFIFAMPRDKSSMNSVIPMLLLNSGCAVPTYWRLADR